MPIMFTNDELALLKEMSKGHPELNDKLNNITPWTHYQSYSESVKEDIMLVLENNDYGEISDTDFEKILSHISNYDYNHYDEFIEETIRNVINSK